MFRLTLPPRLALVSFVALMVLCVALPAIGMDQAGDEDTAEDTAEDAAEGAMLDQVAGTVTKVGNLGFGLVPDSEPGTRYAPTEPLDEEFQHDGLRVRFSGIVGDPDESSGRGGRGGRRWGTPFEVTQIELLEVTDDGDPSGEPGSSESAERS